MVHWVAVPAPSNMRLRSTLVQDWALGGRCAGADSSDNACRNPMASDTADPCGRSAVRLFVVGPLTILKGRGGIKFSMQWHLRNVVHRPTHSLVPWNRPPQSKREAEPTLPKANQYVTLQKNYPVRSKRCGRIHVGLFCADWVHLGPPGAVPRLSTSFFKELQ